MKWFVYIFKKKLIFIYYINNNQGKQVFQNKQKKNNINQYINYITIIKL